MAHEANAILAISSTDRYITNKPGNVNQPVSDVLDKLYANQAPFSNDFTISSPNALMNGYIDRVVISQIQLQYNVPTIVPTNGTQGNDIFTVALESAPGSSVYGLFVLTIPYGYYTPVDLAATLTAGLATVPIPIVVTAEYGATYPNLGNRNSFTFRVRGSQRIFFPSPDYIRLIFLSSGLTDSDLVVVLRTYRLLGITTSNFNPETIQSSSATPQFLYTPYIDIYSDSLTNYQKLKDTDSSTSKRKGLVARLYLSGVGAPQFTFAEVEIGIQQSSLAYNGQPITGFISSEIPRSGSFGSEPFIVTYDLNNPKVVKWSRDTAINSLDFQLRDCYGDLLYCQIPGGSEVFNTEWQMTLLCIEGDD
jgi:hypothetical protein